MSVTKINTINIEKFNMKYIIYFYIKKWLRHAYFAYVIDLSKILIFQSWISFSKSPFHPYISVLKAKIVIFKIFHKTLNAFRF